MNIGKNIKKMDIETKLKIRRKIHKSFTEDMKGFEKEKFIVDDKYFENPTIKITDFGHFCPDEDIMEEDFAKFCWRRGGKGEPIEHDGSSG